MLPDLESRTAPADQLQGLPVLIVHGTYDSVLSVEFGRAIRDALERLPVSLTYREYEMGHHVSEQSFADVTAWLEAQLEAPDWRTNSVAKNEE